LAQTAQKTLLPTVGERGERERSGEAVTDTTFGGGDEKLYLLPTVLLLLSDVALHADHTENTVTLLRVQSLTVL
jgi:hypothetical protein